MFKCVEHFAKCVSMLFVESVEFDAVQRGDGEGVLVLDVCE